MSCNAVGVACSAHWIAEREDVRARSLLEPDPRKNLRASGAQREMASVAG